MANHRHGATTVGRPCIVNHRRWAYRVIGVVAEWSHVGNSIPDGSIQSLLKEDVPGMKAEDNVKVILVSSRLTPQSTSR